MIAVYGRCSVEHQYCIVDEIVRLMDLGFRCYIEYALPLEEKKKPKRLVVDILATKDKGLKIIEVGTLSNSHPDRLKLIKSILPEATVLHITQWKNFLTNFDWDKVNLERSISKSYISI